MNGGAEWLESDALGGYAFGRADGVRTRRYHALLTAATTPPTGRTTLVNGFDAWVETAACRVAISSQRYGPDPSAGSGQVVTHPDGTSRLVAFAHEPWPTWTYALGDGVDVIQELVVLHGLPLVALSWRLSRTASARLTVRPFLSGRAAHGEHHENTTFDFAARVDGPTTRWRPYASVPDVVALASGTYAHDPTWYRNFHYDEERARGLGFLEDLASPGSFAFELSATDRAVLIFAADGPATPEGLAGALGLGAIGCWEHVAAVERTRRARFPTALHRAADVYVVQRGAGKTIIAGYPWFGDWGRDTFIALRGLCIAGSRLSDARDILLEWSGHVSDGMLPNFFPDAGTAPAYNAVDASLWFVVAVYEYLQAAASSASDVVPPGARAQLEGAVDAIVGGYAAGTRHGIRADASGLLACGEAGVQLTWMDVKIGDWVVTPRIGKPVEVQALWINALRIAGERAPRWAALADVAQASFDGTFWYGDGAHLYDVVDVNHVRGAVDTSFRPNQLFAVAGLPWPLVTGERARLIVDAVHARLWTPAGLRSLAREEPDYTSYYVGDMHARDAAYHRGTVWPWLIGAFIDAWVRVRGDTIDARREALARFLAPLIAHYDASAPGQIGEVADGDAPHQPGGCPFQAWSVGEALRVQGTTQIDRA